MERGDALREAVSAAGDHAFAVLDGARFADLPDALRHAGVEGRCLYLDRGDNHPERLVSAPWLIGPLEERALATVLSLLGETGPSAGVLWSHEGGADALFRHLRGINMVRVAGTAESGPGERSAAGEPAAEDADADDAEDGETVLFRHCDANVLAQVLPELDAAQRARFLGPAAAVVYVPDERWGTPTRVVRQEGGPRPPAGLLALERGTIERIDAGRRAALERHVVRYLRRTLPAPVDQASDAELARAASDSVARASAYGVTGDGGHCRWAYLHVVTGGAIARDEKIDRFMTQEKSSATPDQRVRQIMEAMIFRLREGA